MRILDTMGESMRQLRFHFLQHVEFEGPGLIAEWIKGNGHYATFTHFWEVYKLPQLDDIDVLVILGGPMSIFDDDDYPWIGVEKNYIKSAIHKKKKIIGICLGAQFLANRLGADVYENDYPEIGWFPVKKAEDSDEHPVIRHFPEEQTVFHWHGDTFDIPKGATRIASSAACENQGFIYNNHVLALQFHIEMTIQSIQLIVKHCYESVKEDKYVQSTETIANTASFFERNKSILFNILSSFTEK